MILELGSDFKSLDKMTQDILFHEFEEELIDEGFNREEARIHMEMVKEELIY